MKNLFNLFLLSCVLAVSVTSCETLELENLASPNGLSPDQADPNLLLNAIQLAYVNNMIVMNDQGSALTRIDNYGSNVYALGSGLTGGSLNATWNRSYSSGASFEGASLGMFTNIQRLELLNEDPEVDLSYHLGMSKAMQAHMLMLLVDYVGDIPWSQALNPEEFPNPEVDSGDSVYEAALGLLDEAEDYFDDFTANGTLLDPGLTDFFYAGNGDNWNKMINTVRMKAYITTGDLSSFEDIADDEDDYISEAEEDFQFEYSTNVLQPDTRHQDYAADYTPSGANIYQSNWLMNYMLENDDPRIRYYFFRQTGCTPGADCNPDGNGETLSCSLQTPPAHYTLGGFTYCYLPDGYWGRDHGDPSGTPPDALLRTAVGVYPAGGKFDGDLFRNGTVELIDDNDTPDDDTDDTYGFVLNTDDDGVGLGLGAGGAGIEPIFLSWHADFMRAEAALLDGDDDSAEDFLRSGIEKSIEKVQSFADPTFNSSALLDDTEFNESTGAITQASFSGALVPEDEDNEDFVDDILDDFDDSDTDEQFNILARQYWVAMYGNGAEAYNFYRRTGFPTTLQPNLNPTPGPFPRSFPYPTSEVTANPNVSQKSDLTVQVFWDNNPPSSDSGSGFPIAN